MNYTEATTTAAVAAYTISLDGREWWEGLNGPVRRHDGLRVHAEVIGALDVREGLRDFLALCDDGELIVVSGWALGRGALADVTPYWKNAK